MCCVFWFCGSGSVVLLSRSVNPVNFGTFVVCYHVLSSDLDKVYDLDFSCQ